MRWSDLTADELRTLATDLDDRAHDEEVEREVILQQMGFDMVEAMRVVAEHLRDEARKRSER